MNDFLHIFFSSHRTGRTSGKNLQGYRRYSDNYWATCKIISVRTKRSIDLVLREKEGYRRCEKKVSPILSPSTDYGGHRVIFYAQQCFLAFGLCGNWYETCSLTPRRMLKTEPFKWSYSSCEKEFWSFFL